MMPNVTPASFTVALVKALAFAIALVFSLWFMYTVINTVLLIFLSVITAMLLNAPVTWLQNKRCPRTAAVLIVFLAILIVLGVMIWLVIPIINMQFKNLMQNLPLYLNNIERKLATWKASYFHVPGQTQEHNGDSFGNSLSLPDTLEKLGGFSISIIGGVVLGLLLGSLTIYMVLYPRPLLQLYLSLFPVLQRSKAANVFTKTSSMLRGWMRANLIGGAVEAIAVILFLSIMKVPGAWVWGMLAVVAQFFPKVGFYMMSVPPTLVAFSLSPWTAL
jgi:putative permease